MCHVSAWAQFQRGKYGFADRFAYLPLPEIWNMGSSRLLLFCSAAKDFKANFKYGHFLISEPDAIYSFCFSHRLLFHPHPNPIVYCAYSMGWYQPRCLCDLEKITLPAISLLFSGHLRSSGQPGKVWCDPASGSSPLDHSRAPELRGAQPLVNKQGLIWLGREEALKPIW